MVTAIKTFCLLLGFFFFLCITIKGKPLFTHMYNVVSPATTYVQNVTEDFFGRSVASTQTYSKKLFDNSVPRMKDSVGSKLSGRQKAGEPEERITTEEKEELDALIKNH